MLCKSQAPKFQLRLVVWRGSLDETEVWKRLWPYFEEIEDVNEYPKIVISQFYEYYACYDPLMEDIDDGDYDETPTSSTSTSSKARTSSSEPARKRSRE
uniref:Chromo domain-containing protein n=1 Tax=Panagrellus redivivus TaxID=6233 RepID=A0A7E4UTD7_PANRE